MTGGAIGAIARRGGIASLGQPLDGIAHHLREEGERSRLSEEHILNALNAPNDVAWPRR